MSCLRCVLVMLYLHHSSPEPETSLGLLALLLVTRSEPNITKGLANRTERSDVVRCAVPSADSRSAGDVRTHRGLPPAEVRDHRTVRVPLQLESGWDGSRVAALAALGAGGRWRWLGSTVFFHRRLGVHRFLHPLYDSGRGLSIGMFISIYYVMGVL